MTPLAHLADTLSGRITALAPVDILHVDPEPLLRLRAAEGPQIAAARVAEAREVIAYRAGRLPVHHRACAFDALCRDTRAIAAVAGPIGLTDLTLVAAHVLDCVARTDAAGLGATLARLDRLCTQALDLTSALRLTER